MDDPRSSTLTAYLRVLKDTLPKTFVLENVHGLAFKGKDEGLRYILDGIAAINKSKGTSYKVSWAKLNAADYGVPQVRERVVLVGQREGHEFSFPEPTHSQNHKANLSLGARLGEAFADLPAEPNEPGLQMGGRWADLLPSIPEGENYLWHTPRGGGLPLFGWRTRYWSFLLKLAKNRPSWTLQAQPGSALSARSIGTTGSFQPTRCAAYRRFLMG
ncbi:DNA cytosine methyltransferase [Caulobacter segnis]